MEKFNFDEQITKKGDVADALSVTNADLAKNFKTELESGQPIIFMIAETRNPEQVQVWAIQLREDWKKSSNSLLAEVQGWDTKLVRANITVRKEVAVKNDLLVGREFVINGKATHIFVKETTTQRTVVDEATGEVTYQQKPLVAGKDENSPVVTSKGQPIYQNNIIDFADFGNDVILEHDILTNNNAAISKTIITSATTEHLSI